MHPPFSRREGPPARRLTEPVQVALRWVLQRDVVAVTSSDKLSHISSDLAALEFALTDEEMEQLGKVR